MRIRVTYIHFAPHIGVWQVRRCPSSWHISSLKKTTRQLQ
jgi:hypothetical protein